MAERADELRALIDQYAPYGFRDGDGVWHDGPHRIAAFAALDALLAELEAAQDALRTLAEITPHKRGCDQPDDPGCPACVVESEVARIDAGESAASGGGSYG